MAGCLNAPIVTFVLLLLCVWPSLSEKATFKQQESYVNAVSTKGRDVEHQFRGNECLLKVLNELVLFCKDGQQITDQRLRNLFAFKIMNCYANFTFKEDFPCSSANVSACIDVFVERHGGEVQEMYRYLERLMQVDNLCVAMQQDKWQAEMNHLMEQLLQSSAVAVDKLAEARSRQMQLSQQQRHAEENQDKILDAGQKTQATLNSSHQEMNESFSSVFAFLREQQQLIAEMFGEFNVVANSFSFILSMFQGKVSFLHSLIFFVLVLALVYEITGSKYTQRSFLWQRYYAMLVGGAVLGFAVVQQVLKGSPQSSQQLRDLSKRLDNIGRRVSISPTHRRASMGPGLSPILIQESSGVGELQIDEPDYAPPQEAAASAVRRSSEVLLQEAAVCQESYASVIAEEEWSNGGVGFNVSKADEVHRGEKGEEEVRGEKETREVKRTRGGPPKRTLVRQSLARREEEGSGLTVPAHKYNLRRRTLGATPSH